MKNPPDPKAPSASSADIREKFLRFFEERGHRRVPSSPLVPAGDPTLLFTNSGMVQFKDVFLGFDRRPYDRAVTAQRCLRVSGKHNDLENVGYTARHHTFFEMLGNFSFGDYFKEKAIPYAWEFLTSPEGLALPRERLWVTIFGGGHLFGPDAPPVPADEDAAAIWLETLTKAGFSPDEAKRRIARIPTADNFWMMGETGPCGPCSEIFYNRNRAATRFEGEDPDKADDCVEVWNLVFMQFNRDDSGILRPLPAPCVDTGMGLERISAVLQGVRSNFEIDSFRNLAYAANRAVVEAGGHDCANDLGAPHCVISDHIRAAAFLVVDGVLPSNEGRGYVLRRIIRRALRHGYKLQARTPFLHKIVDCPALAASEELQAKKSLVKGEIEREEKQFFATLGRGIYKLLREISDVARCRAVLEYSRLKDPDVWLIPGAGVGGATLISTNGGAMSPKSAIIDAVITHLVEKEPLSILFAVGGRGKAWDMGTGRVIQEGDDLSTILGDKKYPRPVVTSRLMRVLRECFGVSEQEVVGAMAERNFWGVRVGDAMPLFNSVENLATMVGGEFAFNLYDTHGFPVDLTADVIREYNWSPEKWRHEIRIAGKDQGLSLSEEALDKAVSAYHECGLQLGTDTDDFDRCMSEQRERSRAAMKFKVGQKTVRYDGAPTEFVGYDSLRADKARVLAVYANDESAGECAEGDAVVVLDRTPFYAESGGQVGDSGILRGADSGSGCEVLNTRKLRTDVWEHSVKIKSGAVRVGDVVSAEVDAARRMDIARAHSATHLMHSALRMVLGEHVAQRGSLVESGRLRFDFSHNAAMTADELRKAEQIVNEQIRRNAEAQTETLPYDDAVARGATALFGEKYGDIVRMVTIGAGYSVELCGGTHVGRAGDIGYFRFTGETAVGTGTRRVEAVVGKNAVDLSRVEGDALAEAIHLLKVEPKKVGRKVQQLQAGLRSAHVELNKVKMKENADSAVKNVRKINADGIGEVNVVTAKVLGIDPKTLRNLAMTVAGRLGQPCAVFLAGVGDDNVGHLAASVSRSLSHTMSALEWMTVAANKAGARGGGRPEFAQAGGGDVDKLDAALKAADEWVKGGMKLE